MIKIVCRTHEYSFYPTFHFTRQMQTQREMDNVYKSTSSTFPVPGEVNSIKKGNSARFLQGRSHWTAILLERWTHENEERLDTALCDMYSIKNSPILVQWLISKTHHRMQPWNLFFFHFYIQLNESIVALANLFGKVLHFTHIQMIWKTRWWMYGMIFDFAWMICKLLCELLSPKFQRNLEKTFIVLHKKILLYALWIFTVQITALFRNQI